MCLPWVIIEPYFIPFFLLLLRYLFRSRLLYFVDFKQEFFERFNMIHNMLTYYFWNYSNKYKIAKLERLMSQHCFGGFAPVTLHASYVESGLKPWWWARDVKGKCAKKGEKRALGWGSARSYLPFIAPYCSTWVMVALCRCAVAFLLWELLFIAYLPLI